MLKLRLLTALILITCVLWIIFFGSPLIYAPFLVLVAGMAAWEWSGLVPLKSIYSRFAYILLILAGIGCWVYLSFLRMMYGEFAASNLIYYLGLLYLNALGFIFATLAIMTYPKTLRYWHYRWVIMLLGFILITAATISLWFLQYQAPVKHYLMTLLLLTWAADTGAYFAGRFLGKRQFSPHVSPNKTWAGFWGGFLLAEAVVVGAGFLFAAQDVGWIYWISAGTVSILGAVMGDLLISLLKRCVNLKDTGHILPGHGGVLDRIDSLLVSSVVMAFFLFVRHV